MMIGIGCTPGFLALLRRPGGGTPAPSLTAPILADLDEGWTSGDNPPKWKSIYADAEAYDAGTGTGSEVRARWRIDGGAWTTEAWEGLDDELITGELVWPFLEAADLSAGGFFEVQEQHVIDRGLDSEVMSDWSETWSDTLDEIEPEPAGVEWTVNTSPPAAINKEFSSVSHTFTNIAFAAGKAIVRVSMRTRRCTAVTIGGAAASLAVESNAGDGASIWYLDGVDAGDHDVVVTGDSALAWVAIDTGTMTGGTDGAPVSTATLANGFNPDPQVTSTTLTVPTGGVGLAALYSGNGTANSSWSVGTEENEFGAGTTESVYLSTAHLLMTGTPSASGHNYNGAAIAAASWGPA